MEEYEGELTNSIGNMILAILHLYFFFCFLFQDELEWGRSNFIHIKKVREVSYNRSFLLLCKFFLISTDVNTLNRPT